MKEHVYEYDEVVVGNDLPALLYSYKHCCPVIFKNTNPPETYEYLDKDINLQNLFFLEEEKTLELPNEQKIVGTRKLELYNRLLYVLSFSGLMPTWFFSHLQSPEQQKLHDQHSPYLHPLVQWLPPTS